MKRWEQAYKVYFFPHYFALSLGTTVFEAKLFAIVDEVLR